MSVREDPKVTDVAATPFGDVADGDESWWAGSGGFTQITFRPDVNRFQDDGDDGTSPGFEQLRRQRIGAGAASAMAKRVYDVAGCLAREKVSVYLNGELLPVQHFEDFIGLHWRPVDSAEDTTDSAAAQHLVARPNRRWEIGVAASPSGEFTHVSFVNGMAM